MIFVPGKESYDFEGGQIILIDKPLQWTSFDAVNKVRNLIRHQIKKKNIKVGHAGTLDPLATGLLVICTGKFTKTIDTLQAQEKEYEAEFMLGATTPSFDRETEIDQTFPFDHVQTFDIENVIKSFIGKQEQIPPVFSAKQIDGKRAYESARKGREIEMKPVNIEITAFELIECNLPLVKVKICCSKGTYIRSLANDFGKRLQSGAYLYNLRRTASGQFTINNAIEIAEFEKNIKNL